MHAAGALGLVGQHEKGIRQLDLAVLARLCHVENVEHLGPGAALTGPAVRGDVTTIRRNLEALRSAAPAAVGLYVSLCAVAVQLGVDSGRLAAGEARAVTEVLETWK